MQIGGGRMHNAPLAVHVWQMGPEAPAASGGEDRREERAQEAVAGALGAIVDR